MYHAWNSPHPTGARADDRIPSTPWKVWLRTMPPSLGTGGGRSMWRLSWGLGTPERPQDGTNEVQSIALVSPGIMTHNDIPCPNQMMHVVSSGASAPRCRLLLMVHRNIGSYPSVQHFPTAAFLGSMLLGWGCLIGEIVLYSMCVVPRPRPALVRPAPPAPCFAISPCPARAMPALIAQIVNCHNAFTSLTTLLYMCRTHSVYVCAAAAGWSGVVGLPAASHRSARRWCGGRRGVRGVRCGAHRCGGERRGDRGVVGGVPCCCCRCCCWRSCCVGGLLLLLVWLSGHVCEGGGKARHAPPHPGRVRVRQREEKVGGSAAGSAIHQLQHSTVTSYSSALLTAWSGPAMQCQLGRLILMHKLHFRPHLAQQQRQQRPPGLFLATSRTASQMHWGMV
eukprot:gene1068-biopygen3234